MKCSLTWARIKTFLRTAVNCWMVYKWGSCRGKKRYVTYDLAENVRRNYNSRVALQFGAFQAFWCKHHDAWHLGQVLSRNEKLFAQIGARNKYERVTTERRGSHVAGKDQVQDFDDQTYRRFLNGTESDTGKAELDNTNKYFENKTITRWRKNCLYSQLSLRKK